MPSGRPSRIKSLASLMLESGILKRIAPMPAEEQSKELAQARLLYLILIYLSALGATGTAAVCVAFIYIYVLHPLTVNVLTSTQIALCIVVFAVLAVWFALLTLLGLAMRSLLEERTALETKSEEKL